MKLHIGAKQSSTSAQQSGSLGTNLRPRPASGTQTLQQFELPIALLRGLSGLTWGGHLSPPAIHLIPTAAPGRSPTDL